MRKRKNMKTVQFDQYGGPEVLHVAEVADPIPGPEDVLIAVKATTVNHLDLFQRDGSRPVGKLPFTPGLEAVGHPVNHLHRSVYAGLTVEGLAAGSWRELTAREVEQLRRTAQPPA